MQQIIKVILQIQLSHRLQEMQENQLFQNIQDARSQINKLKIQAQALQADPFGKLNDNVNMREYVRSVAYSLNKNQQGIQKKLVEYGNEKNRQKIQRNKLPSINKKKQKNIHDLSLMDPKSAYRKHRKHYKHPSQHKKLDEQSTKIDNSFSLSIQNRPMKIHSSYQKSIKPQIMAEYDSQPPQIPLQILKLKEQAFKLDNESRIRKQRHISVNNFANRKSTVKFIDLNNSANLTNPNNDVLKPPNQVEYNQIVDKYSKHEFMIINGKLVNEGPEFASFSRIYQSIFTKIRIQISLLEQILKEKNVNFARFDGKKLAFLCLKDQVKRHQLVDCLIQETDQLKKMLIPMNRYLGKKGRELAAAKIQAFSRMIQTRNKFLLLRSKTLIIQQFFRKNLNKLELQRKIHERNSKILQNFEDRQEEFMKKWKHIKTKKRVQIHMNNMEIDEEKRLSIQNFGERQNIQLSRIFRLKDQNLIIIYISTSQLPPELINYYYRMLQLANIPKCQDRLIFLSPAQAYKFPKHISVSKLLYYSSKTLKQLKIITQDLPTILYPGQPSNQLIKLCDYLQCYLFSGSPQNIKQFTTKSQTIRFLKNLSLEVLPSAMQMYDYGQFLNTFAVLIMKNAQIKTWVLKIDDEFGGRGIAYFEVGKSRMIQTLIKKVQYGDNTEEFFATDISTQPQNQQITVRIRDYLKESLPQRLRIATPTLYRNYQQFMGKFIKKGGVIQAKPYTDVKGTFSYPSVSFCLFPSGQFQITTTYEKIIGSPYRSYACSFPQKSLDIKQINSIITRICQSFKIRKIFGYYTLDFLHYQQNIGGSSKQFIDKSWIIGMDPYINNYTSSYYLFDVLMSGTFFSQRNSYIVEESDDGKSQTFSVQTMSTVNNNSPMPISQRSYIFLPHFCNPNLFKIKIKQFFKQARIEKFNFDISNKEGLCVLLLDQLTSGMMSLMSVGRNQDYQVQQIKKVIEFIVRITDVKNVGYGTTDLEPSTDQIGIKDVLSLFTGIVRKRERLDAKNKAVKKFKNTCNLDFIS